MNTNWKSRVANKLSCASICEVWKAPLHGLWITDQYNFQFHFRYIARRTTPMFILRDRHTHTTTLRYTEQTLRYVLYYFFFRCFFSHLVRFDSRSFIHARALCVRYTRIKQTQNIHSTAFTQDWIICVYYGILTCVFILVDVCVYFETNNNNRIKEKKNNVFFFSLLFCHLFFFWRKSLADTCQPQNRILCIQNYIGF